MIPFRYVGVQGALIKTSKAGWKSGKTGADMLFVHGGPIEPSIVHRFGLSPSYASEYIVGDDDQVISGGKMIFAFLVCAGNQPPANAEKPPAVGRLWGMDGHSYVFLAPAQTTYWCQDADIRPGREVAFEYVIESRDIVSYWAPSSNYSTKLGQGNAPRSHFQAVSWHAYTSAYARELNSI